MDVRSTAIFCDVHCAGACCDGRVQLSVPCCSLHSCLSDVMLTPKLCVVSLHKCPVLSDAVSTALGPSPHVPAVGTHLSAP